MDDHLAMRFPAIAFSQNLVNTLASNSALRRTTRVGLKKGYYDALILVDSTGKRFDISGAQIVRTIPRPFSFAGLFDVLSGDGYPEVEPIVSAKSPTTISLNEVKDRILDSFETERHSWEPIGDIREIRDRIQRAISLEQVFSILRELHV